MSDDLKSYLRMMIEMKSKMSRPSNFMSQEEYVLTHGREFLSAKLTPAERAIVREAMGLSGHDFPIKECFSNSQELVLADPTGQISYAEGYVVLAAIPFPIHHGWGVLNGKVIDLTCRVQGKRGLANRVLGKFSDRVYFGAEFSAPEVTRAVFKRKWYGSLLDDYQNDWPYLRGKPW